MDKIDRPRDRVETLTYSRRTAAIAMCLSERKFDQVVVEWGIPSFRIDRCRRYRKSDLQAAIDRVFAEQHEAA